jgi:hypothetical protein
MALAARTAAVSDDVVAAVVAPAVDEEAGAPDTPLRSEESSAIPTAPVCLLFEPVVLEPVAGRGAISMPGHSSLVV